MPQLWTDTIEGHRHAVREAILDATASLVADHGVSAVNMSRVADRVGIGRATLYKYFPDIESILTGWHERQIAEHLRQLAEVRDQARPPRTRLEAVLRHYAAIAQQRHDTETVALLHRGAHVFRAQQQLRELIRDLIIEGARSGDLRDDINAEELAAYCLHALTAAGNLHTKAAAERLVQVTLDGLRH